jgi:hypothetical protein
VRLEHVCQYLLRLGVDTHRGHGTALRVWRDLVSESYHDLVPGLHHEELRRRRVTRDLKHVPVLEIKEGRFLIVSCLK